MPFAPSKSAASGEINGTASDLPRVSAKLLASVEHQVTNVGHLILIKLMTGDAILISPDDPAAFEDALRPRLSMTGS